MSQRMFTVTPKQAREEIVHCIGRGRVPFLISSPGLGKSSIVHQIAEDFRLKLIDVRLSQCTPEDLQGFPMRVGNKASFVPFDIFPTEEDEIPEGYDGWLLFLDEVTSATKPVQAAAYKLILDRMVGSRKLHDRVVMVGAGNKGSDKAVVNQISTALQSRVVWFELVASAPEWTEHAYQKGWDHRVISFIQYQPSKLMDFRPDHQDVSFPCPRTWEILSDLIQGESLENRGARVSGAIGEGCAVEFLTFAKEFDRLPRLPDIVANPKQTPVPPEASTKYATMSMLIENFDDKSLDPILEYVDKFPIEIQVVFCRGVVARDPKVHAHHAGFGNYIKKMVRYLQ